MKSQIALLTLAVCANFYASHGAWSSVKPEQVQNNSLQYHLDQLTFANKGSGDYEVDSHESTLKSNSVASPSLGKVGPVVDDETEAKDDFRNAIGVDYGVFSSGFWMPIQSTDGYKDWTYNDCNAFTFCSPEGLFGGLVNIAYTRRLVAANRNSLDLDVAAGVGWQSPVINSNSQGVDYVESYRGGENQFFGLFTVMPTYRLRVFEWLSVGAGGGVSYAVNGVPADMGGSLNFASKIEIGLRPFENKTIETTFSFNHRCAVFGLLNESGRLTGSQWYSLGFRKWF